MEEKETPSDNGYKMRTPAALALLREEVVACRRCPRLVAFRESVAPKAPYQDQPYWRRPVPGFGDPNAWLLIIGLAPAPQGGNRTGRIFTGDLTARFLMPALFKQGFANQPTSESLEDGLQLQGCYMTAAVKCVPPQNKPSSEECRNCSGYLHRELAILRSVDSVLALGRLAFEAYFAFVKQQGVAIQRPPFKHGGIFPMPGFPTLYASYHPSPQNTNTGILTASMFQKVLTTIQARHHDKNIQEHL